MRQLFAWLVLVTLSWFSTGSVAQKTDSQSPLTFGVFPYLPPARLEQLYAPVAADLSRAIGRPIQLRTRADFKSFSGQVREQSYDLIFIQPFAYVQLAKRHDYHAMARPGKPLAAVMVTPETSAIHSMDDLRGKNIVAPPRQAAVSILGLQMLLEHNLQPGDHVQVQHKKSHAACLRQALIDKNSVCITALPPLFMFSKKSGIQFRIIARSDSIPASTLAIHSRVTAPVREALLKQVLEWGKTDSGKKLLSSLQFVPFIPSLDKDYDSVRLILEETKTFRGNPVQHEPESK